MCFERSIKQRNVEIKGSNYTHINYTKLNKSIIISQNHDGFESCNNVPD